MNDFGWRGRIASWLHRLGYKFWEEEFHDVVVKDAEGKEIFSIATQGGWVATGPPEPYTLHCGHYDGDDNYVLHDI